MMRAILCLLLAGCAHTEPSAVQSGCPALPEIGASQAVADYTVTIIEMYKVCRAKVNG